MKYTNNTISKANNTNGSNELHPDIVAKVNEVKAKIKANDGDVTHDDLTTAIANSRHLLLNFLMDNNLPNIAATLKTQLREKMDFEPKREQVEGILAAYINKMEYGKLQKVLDNFVHDPNANNYTSNPDILEQLVLKLRK